MFSTEQIILVVTTILFFLACVVGSCWRYSRRLGVTFKDALLVLWRDGFVASFHELFTQAVPTAKAVGSMVWAYIRPMAAAFYAYLSSTPPTHHIFTDDLWGPFSRLVDDYRYKLLGCLLTAYTYPLPSCIYIQFYTKTTANDDQILELISHLSTAFEHYMQAYDLSMPYCPCYYIEGSKVTIYIYYCENPQDLPAYRERVRIIIATQTGSTPGQLKLAVKPPASKTAITLGYAASAWDEGGQKVSICWDLMRDPHLLIAGVTGSGKSVLAQWVVLSLMRQGAQFYICDFKAGGDWTDACSQYAQFSKCGGLVAKFYNAFIEALETGTPAERPQVLLFDEFNSFALAQSSADFKVLMDQIRAVAQMGRSYNFHLILVGQQFSAKVLETGIREQLATRVYMGRTISLESSKMLFPGCDIDQATVLGKHRGYVITADRGFETMVTPEFDHPERLLNHIQAFGHRK